ASLLQVPGLGPGRARAVYQELGISTLPELEQAARSGRLQDVPGFGPRAIDALLGSLDKLKQRSSRGLLSDAWAAFGHIREALARGRGWRLTSLGLEDDASGTLLEREREAAIYERLDLPWIPPELREDEGEIEAAQSGRLPRLIELGDIKGDLHTHTNWTDGSETLEEMAKRARAKGYAYMAVTDHTQNLAMTR